MAYGCLVSLFFNLDISSAFLCPLWPWPFWRVQASGFVECPSIWECLTYHCVPSGPETSDALSEYLLPEETIRWKEKADFLVSPTPSLFLTERCSLVAIIVYIGSNPAVFITQPPPPPPRPQRERLPQGIVSLLPAEACKQTLGDGLAGLLERRMEHLMRGETQPGGPSQC